MCLVVSRSNLAVHSRAEIEKTLTSKLGGRLLQALLDLDDQFPELRKRYAESETDRAARMEQINELTDSLKESESDRAARLKVIEAPQDNMTMLEGKLKEETKRAQDVEQGLEAALARKKQDCPSRERILDGEKEAHLIALSCSKPPEGRARWTLHLLADKLVELEIVDEISYQTVRRTLKKTN